jgi:carbonic anhydrase
MKNAAPLPDNLTARYRDWRERVYTPDRKAYEDLAAHGQTPPVMMISCCDSRVHGTQIFDAGPGDMFIHRNVAALVPPSDAAGRDRHCTASAVEFAVRVLKVGRILVMGHSQCGGVKGCHDMCSGHAPELLDSASFVGGWIELLRPGFERLPAGGTEAERLTALEKQAVLLSLENLMTYPWLADAVAAGTLELTGLWNDIGAGVVEAYAPETDTFAPL